MTTTSATERRQSTVLFGLIVLGLCVGALFYERDIRVVEAAFAERVLGLFGTSSSRGTVVFAWLDERNAIGLDITPECTVALLGLPVLIAVVLLAWRRRIGRRRLILAGLAGLATVFVGNQLRLAAIAFSTRWWGLEFGFDFSHQVIGSVISLIAACLGVLVVVLLAGSKGT